MALGDSADDTLPASVVATAAARAELPVVARSCYEVLSEHARGGLGRILRARDLRTGRLVAIKEMLDGTPDAATRFAREALVTANLQHPAIVPVYEVGRWPEGEPFYAMKLVDGRSLDAELQDARTLRERLALVPRLIDVAEAIAYAHGQGVIHRDLKPANVLVGSYGETVVIDWGLARRSGDPEAALSSSLVGVISGAVTLVGDVVGTPAYMPPEQARGEEVDARADVYALGAMLYYLLGGRVPYAGARTAAEVLTQILLGPPQPLVELEPELPPELLAIVAKAMAPSRDDRYASARECAADLRRYQTGQLVGAHAYSAWQLIRRRLRRHRAVVTMAAVLVLGLAATGALAVRGITRERNVARAQRARADQQRDQAEARSRQLILDSAATWITRDATQALAWLKQLPAGAREWHAVRDLIADAREHGVARWVLRGHVGNVNDVEFTPDGRAVVSGGDDGTLRRWDLGTGAAQVLRGEGPIDTVMLAAGGASVIAVGPWDAGSPVGRAIDVWSFATGARWTVPPDRERNADALVAPDGASLAVITCRGTVRLYPLASLTARELRATDGRKSDYCPNAMAFSADGRWLAAESTAATIDLIEVATGRTARRLDVAALDGVGQVGFDPSGARLVVMGAHDVGAWDLTDGSFRRLFDDQTRFRGFVMPAPDQVVFASNDGSLRRWTAGEQGFRVLARHDGAIRGMVLAPGHRIVTGGFDGMLRVTDVAGTASRVLSGHRGGVTEVELSADAQWLASSAADGTVRVWSLDGARRSVDARARGADSVVMSPTGALTVAGRNGCVERWTLTGPPTLRRPCSEAAYLLMALVQSADGGIVAAARLDGGVDVWRGDAASPTTLPGPLVAGMAMSADGRYLAVVDRDGAVRLHDLAAGAVRVLASSQAQRRAIRPVAIAPDAAWVAWAASPSAIGLYERAADRMRSVAGGRGELREAVPTPDGRALVTVDAGGAVVRWDLPVATPHELATYPGAARLVLDATGQRLAVADASYALHVLTLAGAPAAPPLFGHVAEINQLAFAPDGRTLASAADDDSARLWSLDDGAGRVLPHHESVYALAFTPDSRQLVTATRYGTLSAILDDLPRDEAGLGAFLATATNLEVAPPGAPPH